MTTAATIEGAWAAVDHAMRWAGRWDSVRDVPDLMAEMKIVLDEEKAAVRAGFLASHVPYCAKCQQQGTCEAKETIDALGNLPSKSRTPR